MPESSVKPESDAVRPIQGRYWPLLVMVLSLCLLIGAMVVGVALQQRVTTPKAWVDAGGKAHVQAIVNDFAAMSQDGQDLGALSAACTKLGTDVASAQAFMPIPNADAQTHWANALNYLTTASSKCVEVINTGSSSELAAVQLAFEQATAELQALEAVLQPSR
jgi:hypothetical protein